MRIWSEKSGEIIFISNKNFQIPLDNNFWKNKKWKWVRNNNKMSDCCIWLSVFLLAGDLPICKNCKWQIGHPFVSLDGVSSSGDHPFLFNFVGKNATTLRTCSWWFMLRVPPWCRKSQFRQKNYVRPPYQLN